MKDFEKRIKEIKDEILSEIKQVAKNSAVAIEPYFISAAISTHLVAPHNAPLVSLPI